MPHSTSIWTSRRWLLPTAVVAAVIVVVGLVAGVHLTVTGWGTAPASSSGRPVTVHVVQGRKVAVPVMRSYRRPQVSWPAAVTATARITSTAATSAKAPLAAGPSAGSAQAGSLPVWVGPPDKASSQISGHAVTAAFTGAAAVSRVQVSMAPHSAVTVLGVHGAVFSIARADGSSAAGQVHVSVDYGSFAGAYGGGYASRLHLVELPACALTTPQVDACRKQTPLSSGSVDSVKTDRVGADVTLPAATTAAALAPANTTTLTAAVRPMAASSSVVVLAVTSAMSGSGGDYVAEPVSDATEWVNGGSSGAYTDSYPITVPPVPGGLEPTVALNYDSQATDGLTPVTNNQASWVGDGWDYSPGFIEQELAPCTSQAVGDDGTTSLTPVGDLCPAGKLTLSLDGTQSTMVKGTLGKETVYHAEGDDGGVITGTDPNMGLADGSYWVLAEPDGTDYYFGLNQLPGYASGDQATDSVWTVPNGGIEGETGNPLVWRWMLDYVTSASGNAIAYFYNTQTNYYAEQDGTTGTGEYTQGGTLARIEYGLRAGDIYGYTPAAEVSFTSTAGRQDAPTDLTCTEGVACALTSPTFWNDDELTGISTESLKGSTLEPVDSWALTGSYPATGDSTTPPSLWLSSITQTGQDGSTPIALPPTTFAGKPMPNLVATTADTAAGYSLLTRFRLTSIASDTGAVTTITYASPSCTAGAFPVPGANTTTCYPQYWTPSGGSTTEDWYGLYSASTVTVTDTTGGNPPVVTSYTYAGPAWHYDDDTISRSLTTTWDQWRGYQTVTTETGTAPDPVTETVDTYFQGMNQDLEPSSDCLAAPCYSSVTLTSSHGDKVTDTDGYAGTLFESIIHDGAGGSEVTDTIDLPEVTVNAGTFDGVTAVMVGDTAVHTYTALAGGGTRESTVTYSYDSLGRTTAEYDVPDTSQPSESTCTRTTYTDSNPDQTTNMDLSEVAQTLVLTQPGCTASYYTAAELISATAHTYNSAQDRTGEQKATGVTVTDLAGIYTDTLTWETTSTSTYDEYGRVLTATDADNRTTTTAYAPATGAEPTSVQVTDPMGLVTTTTYDPARDLPLTVTDPAGDVTTTAYDALGRETDEWAPGNPVSGPATTTYAYAVSNAAPQATTEHDLEPDGNYLTTDTIDDSLGNALEVQQETASGGTDVTDTSYNSDGWKSLDSGPYYVTGAPSGTLVQAASSSVPEQTGYVYDGDGRVLRQISYDDGSETWETDTAYGGDYVTVTPPTGGTPETTWTNGEGETTAISEYHAGAPVSTSDPASDYDATTYTYTPEQKLATITDAAGNQWSYTYDLLGDQLTQSDPDAGTSTSTYDAAQQLMSVTDARGKITSYTYDADGRKTAEYDTTGGALESTADELASWTYDTLAKGQLTSSAAYEGGAQYTEQVTGYNSQGLPEGTETIIPSSQAALADTYTQTYTYAPDGAETSYTDSAAGGLPAETVTTGYDSAGDPDSLTGASPYVDSLSYTNLDQPLQYTMGTSPEPAYVTDTYDPTTGNLTQQDTQTGTAETSVDDLNYTYNDVGDITSEADTPSGNPSATDFQCFQYDYLNRLVQAWAQGTSGCAATPSASVEGGAAPYWDSYSYSVIGNLTGVTSTTPAGAVTTTADTYPAAGAAHPHAITGQSVTTSTGTTSSGYTYDAAGDLTAVTGTGQGQALTWNDAGQLTQNAITPASGGTVQDTSYLYDADGTLLLEAGPGTTNLYLADEELSLDTSTGVVTGTRYYALGDDTIATLTGASPVAYIVGDQQDTKDVAISASSLAVADRYYDPYGNPIGTPATAFPDGKKGFIGGITDTTTSLTDLGAREYQSQTGSFISPDPLLTPEDPQDLNAYTYAADNPTTFSDPTGASAQERCPNAGDAWCAPPGGTGGGTKPTTSKPRGVSQKKPATYSIYIIYDPNGTPVYVGQTNNPGRRKGEHSKPGGKLPAGFEMRQLIGGLTLGQADGIEQIIIDTLGMDKNDGILSNKRNEILPGNSSYNGDMNEAVQILADNPGVVQKIVDGADTTYDSYARGNAYDLQSYTDYIRKQDEYGSLQNADKATNNLVKEDTSLELNAGESPIDVCDVDPELCS
jgi:RHS repeat-associated protein